MLLKVAFSRVISYVEFDRIMLNLTESSSLLQSYSMMIQGEETLYYRLEILQNMFAHPTLLRIMFGATFDDFVWARSPSSDFALQGDPNVSHPTQGAHAVRHLTQRSNI